MSALNDQEQQLVTWLADMNEDDAVALARRMLLEEKANPLRVLELCRMAMDEVGKRFEQGEYFLPELVLAGEMLETVGGIAKPLITEDGPGQQKLGRVPIGTVHGDLHDIGKNIVSFMLDINGYEVKDIGIDVPVADFVAAIEEFDPQVVALSGFLTIRDYQRPACRHRGDFSAELADISCGGVGTDGATIVVLHTQRGVDIWLAFEASGEVEAWLIAEHKKAWNIPLRLARQQEECVLQRRRTCRRRAGPRAWSARPWRSGRARCRRKAPPAAAALAGAGRGVSRQQSGRAFRPANTCHRHNRFVRRQCAAYSRQALNNSRRSEAMSQAELEMRIARLEDYRDICNLQGRYNHYLQTGQIKEKLPALFALDHPEVKAEMCDSGLWQGAEAVAELFGHMGAKYAMPGALMVHMLLTPVLEVSADGERAKGMWNSLGTNTYAANDGTLEAMWQVGKYDLTFCKQDGKWKYLDFRWYVIFRTPFREGWVHRPMVEGLHEEGFPEVSRYHTPYDPRKVLNHFLPFPPEPAA
jgi:5-methyltetrahydrofolate--homocysteine methyltransferase